MEQASINLEPITSHTDGLNIFFLTGQKYLYQTLYCIQSLARVTTTKFKFTLVDDGSFNEKVIEKICLLLPGAEVITQKIIEKNLDQYLPSDKYPYLNQKRVNYPHIKKLTDVHTIAGSSWKLVLDSDMLFWKEPKEIISWLQNPTQPLHMIDCVESYGYSRNLMENLSKSIIPQSINVGAIGLNSELIDWNNLEKWGRTLEEVEGKTYFLEQALSAMLIGTSASTALCRNKYIVNPSKETINNTVGILHHYVDLSKEDYFKLSWKYFHK